MTNEQQKAPDWENYLGQLSNSLGSMVVCGNDDTGLASDSAFKLWREQTADLREREGIIYLIGNGASASMASHFAADLAKNGELHTQVFTDSSLLTAVANDISYDMVFVVPLSRRLKPGDMLVAISSSGNSPNVVKAAEFAASKQATVVTLSAMQPENALRKLGSINFWLPADSYGMAETGHAAILHYWMDQVSIAQG